MPLPIESGRDLAPRAIRELHSALRVICFYPTHHPSVRTALERTLASLGRFLEYGSDLELGFAEKGVLFEGEYLPDPDHQLRSLANLLLDRGMASLSLGAGVDRDGLEGFLRFLASDPADISRQGGVSKFISSRNLGSIRVVEIDTHKILASEAVPCAEPSTDPLDDTKIWKQLITEFLGGDEGPAPDGVRRTLRGLAQNPEQLSDLVHHLAEEAPEDLPNLLGRLTNEIQREVPTSDHQVMKHLGQAIHQLDPRAQMDLMMKRIPLADGTEDLLQEVAGRMSDPMIVDMVSSFVETESRISPRLVSLCSKVLGTRDEASSFFGPISSQLKTRSSGSQDLGAIWQSLQGLLVESDPAYLSQTYRDNLEAVSRNVESVDAESLLALQASPGFKDAFDSEVIAIHSCRTFLTALELESVPALQEALREEIGLRSQPLEKAQHIALLAEIVEALANFPSPTGAAATPDPPDPKTLQVAERMLRLFRSEYRNIPQEDRVRVIALFQQMGGPLVPDLIEALSEEESVEVRKCLVGILASLSQLAVPLLLKRLDDSSWYLVRHTALLLGEIGDARLADPLAKLLRHSEPRVRREAAKALGKIGGAQAITHLREALQDPRARLHAARVLGEIDRAGTITHLVDRLDRTRMFVFQNLLAREAISLLRELKAQEGIPSLIRILNRRICLPPVKGDHLRIDAAKALWHIGTQEAKAAVTKATERARPVVREACRALVLPSVAKSYSLLPGRETP